MTAPERCRHERTPGMCEACAFEAARDRGALPPASIHDGTTTTTDGVPRSPHPVDTRERVPVDTLVDVGDGRAVLVAAGDPVPVELADRPRTRRDGKPLTAPGKRTGR